MNKDGILAALNTIPFFEGLSAEEKNRLANAENIFVEYQPAEKILEAGQADDAFYVILEGSTAVTRKAIHERTISRMTVGAHFGEIPYLADKPRSVNIVAEGQVTLMKLDKKALETLDLPIQKKLLIKFIEFLAHRLDNKSEQFKQFAQHI